MVNWIARLIILAAFIQLGMTFTSMANCRGRGCWQEFSKQTSDILKIDWKPISVFPKEAKQFR